MNSTWKCLLFNRLQIFLFIFTYLNLNGLQINAQEKPPKPIKITVDNLRHLNFGKVIPFGAGGTVTIENNGSRSSNTNNILLLSDTSFGAALFIVHALPGTLITINPIPDSYLSNSSYQMALKLGLPSTGYMFVVTSESTDVWVGGTLTVGSLMNNPPGSYNGQFTVTFNQN